MAGLTRAEVARRIGCDRGQVAAWARGERFIPAYIAPALAAALDTTAGFLIFGERP